MNFTLYQTHPIQIHHIYQQHQNYKYGRLIGDIKQVHENCYMLSYCDEQAQIHRSIHNTLEQAQNHINQQ